MLVYVIAESEEEAQKLAAMAGRDRFWYETRVEAEGVLRKIQERYRVAQNLHVFEIQKGSPI